jgi:outer membrane protein assembly factor BamB
MKVRFVFFATVLVFLTGCATFRGEEEQNPPAKLGAFEETIKLNRVWKTSSGKIINSNRQIQPILVDTILYTASSEGKINAFDAETGNRIWTRKLDLNLSAGIGYGEGLILVGSEEGEVIALYASNGEPAWVGDVKGGVLASPAGGQNRVVVPTTGNKIVGLSSTDGTAVWTLSETTPRLLLRGRGRPLVVTDVVLAGFDNGKLMLIRLDNGQRLWEIRVGEAIGKTEIERLADVDARPVLIDDTVYAAAYQSRIVAIDAPTAKMIWENKISTNKDMDTDDRHLYVVAERDIVYAINRITGETVWEQDKLTNRNLTPPAVIGSFIIIGDSMGYIHLLDADTGEISGRVKTGSELFSQPVTRGTSAWIQTLDGDVIAWQLAE